MGPLSPPTITTESGWHNEASPCAMIKTQCRQIFKKIKEHWQFLIKNCINSKCAKKIHPWARCCLWAAGLQPSTETDRSMVNWKGMILQAGRRLTLPVLLPWNGLTQGQRAQVDRPSDLQAGVCEYHFFLNELLESFRWNNMWLGTHSYKPRGKTKGLLTEDRFIPFQRLLCWNSDHPWAGHTVYYKWLYQTSHHRQRLRSRNLTSMIKVIKLSREYDARFEKLYTFQSKTSNVTDTIYIYMSIMETKCCPNRS